MASRSRARSTRRSRSTNSTKCASETFSRTFIPEHKPLRFAILSYKGDAGGDGTGDIAGSQAAVVDANVATIGNVGTGYRPQNLRSTGADEPGEPDDLARAHCKADICKDGLAGEAAHLQPNVRALFRFGQRWKMRVETPPDHCRDDLAGREIAHGARLDDASIAHYGDAVRDARQLLHPMGDVDDADPSCSQPRNNGEQSFDLAIGERGRRLVHNDDPRMPGQDFGDLNELLLPDGKLGHRNLEGHSQANSSKTRVARRSSARVDQTRARRLGAERDVCDRGQLRNQGELLIDHADTQLLRLLRRVDAYWRAVD